MTRNAVRGRPRASSRATLEDAANELFLERGYDATSITDIATRAGVSRTSFFSYFPTKADVLWSPIDDHLSALEARAAAGATLHEAIIAEFAHDTNATASVGLLFSDTIGAHDEILASAMPRLVRLAHVVATFEGLEGTLAGADRARVYAITGELVAGWREWLDAGFGRGPLAEYLVLSTPRS